MATPTEDQNWFASRKWGVFIHYLSTLQNGNGNFHNTKGYSTDWTECTEDLDVELLARQLHEINAGYLIFTLMQGTRYLCAPNSTFDEITGYAPGEACSKRDLIEDLYSALNRYDIPLFLYFTGDGPHFDTKGMTAFYGSQPNLVQEKVTPDFVKKWSSVMREYSIRYGGRIKGWWVDGLYAALGYNEKLIANYKQAALRGNSHALFSANYYGCLANDHTVPVVGLGNLICGDFYRKIMPPTMSCDYTAGELVMLDAFNTEQLIDGAQAHILSFLGIPHRPIEIYGGWGERGCKYSAEYLLQYVREINMHKGVVSLDVCMYRNGKIDTDQLRLLRLLGNLRT